ncbi:MAG: hypothetical protein L0Y71_15495 [Gemmataceae bacterium]|nr:hypothetical protein [Gemmataceae bacterium]
MSDPTEGQIGTGAGRASNVVAGLPGACLHFVEKASPGLTAILALVQGKCKGEMEA